jgi:hypothetical protein
LVGGRGNAGRWPATPCNPGIADMHRRCARYAVAPDRTETPMDADAFVAKWYAEKEQLLAAAWAPGTESAARIAAMALSPAQAQQLREVLDVFATDAMYTLLLGLDGSAALGGDQRHYTVLDEDGSVIAEEGDLEAAAYAWFHEGRSSR